MSTATNTPSRLRCCHSSHEILATVRTIASDDSSDSTMNGIEHLIDIPSTAALSESPSRKRARSASDADNLLPQELTTVDTVSALHAEGSDSDKSHAPLTKTNPINPESSVLSREEVEHPQDKQPDPSPQQDQTEVHTKKPEQPKSPSQSGNAPTKPSDAKLVTQPADASAPNTDDPTDRPSLADNATDQPSLANQTQDTSSAVTPAAAAFLSMPSNLAQFLQSNPMPKELAETLARQQLLLVQSMNQQRKQRQRRDRYKCKLCLQPKRGHVCPQIAHSKMEKNNRRSISTQTDIKYTGSKLPLGGS